MRTKQKSVVTLFVAMIIILMFTACTSVDAFITELDGLIMGYPVRRSSDYNGYDSSSVSSASTRSSRRSETSDSSKSTDFSDKSSASNSSNTSDFSSSSGTAVASNTTGSYSATAKAKVSANSNANQLSSNTFVGTPYTVLPAGTNGTAGRDWTYVLFGDWPQTIKAEWVTVDESQRVVVGAHTYFKGSDGYWYVKCVENGSSGYQGNGGFRYSDGTKVSLTGKTSKYFKVEPIKWRVVTTNYNGSGKKLLLAENALTAMNFYDHSFDDTDWGVRDNMISFYPEKSFRKLDNGDFIHHNNYEYSRVRAFLNGTSYWGYDSYHGTFNTNEEFVSRGFLQTAFTPELQAQIAVTHVDNGFESTGEEVPYADVDISRDDRRPADDVANASLLFDKYLYDFDTGTKTKKWCGFLCDDTDDKVFLLSAAEAVRSDYGFKEIAPRVNQSNVMSLFWSGVDYTWEDLMTTYKELIREMTDFAKANGVSHYEQEGVTSWTLRTPVYCPYYGSYGIAFDQTACAVDVFGGIEDVAVHEKGSGIVPALCIK